MAVPSFLSYDVELDKTFGRALDRAIESISDLRPVLKSIAIDFYQSEKAIFNLKTAGAYEDFKGPKISDTWKTPGRPSMRMRDGSDTAYQYAKKKKWGFDYPLLKASGSLEKSVTTNNDSNSIYELDKQSLTIGTRVQYADYHQSDKTRKKIPLRKFLFIGPESGGFPPRLYGRLPRWTNMINSYVLRSFGATPKEAGLPNG